MDIGTGKDVMREMGLCHVAGELRRRRQRNQRQERSWREPGRWRVRGSKDMRTLKRVSDMGMRR